ncbi:MAG: hypothetical protein L6290_10555 [Thermodesulfovibrionales bacterium]|nr:hypothetical protein [Thermodesulfovibrionales bacterium]
MKKVVGIISIGFLFLYIVGSVSAGNLGKYSGSIKVARQVNGMISSIDLQTMIITIEHKVNGEDVESSFVFDQGTSVMKDDEIKTLYDLEKGDVVAVIYVHDGNNKSAKKIKIGGE